MLSNLKLYYRYNFRFKNTRVLSRVACLGSDILRFANLSVIFNHQKSRVDYTVERHYNKKNAIDYNEVYSILDRKYVLGAISSQRYDFFNYKKPDLIVMDSYSELTDQLFFKKATGDKFLANYSDTNAVSLQNYGYESEGLLDILDFDLKYESFFDLINFHYSGIPVIFIHFSTELDPRVKFKDRSIAINESILKISDKYKFLKSLKLSDNLVFKSDREDDPERDFPYHYSNNTYLNYFKEFDKLIKGG